MYVSIDFLQIQFNGSILSFERLIELARWINFEIQRKKNIPYAFFF